MKKPTLLRNLHTITRRVPVKNDEIYEVHIPYFATFSPKTTCLQSRDFHPFNLFCISSWSGVHNA
jgi:hypothetical protein